MKKLVLLLLSIVMILALVSCDTDKEPEIPTIPETAASEFEYELSETDEGSYIIINKYIGTADAVRIPQKIDGTPVKLINFGAFGKTAIKSVIIPDSVTNIANYAFSDCTNLTEITFGDGITTIWDNAFEGCTALKEVALPKKLETLYSEAFLGCISLEKVSIPKTLTNWKMHAFANCTALTSITFEDGIKIIGGNGTFFNAAVETLTIPASVEKIEEPFFSCNSLKSITFLGDAPEGLSKTEFSDEFGTPNKDLIIYYDANTSGWDTTPLRESYTLIAK